MQPFVQIVSNRTFTGALIENPGLAMNETFRKSDAFSMGTAEVWRGAAKALYDGTEMGLKPFGIKPLDVTPEGLRTFVTGLTGGFLKFIPALMEQGDPSKIPGYTNTRDSLGPALSALGLHLFWHPEARMTNAKYFEMVDTYNADMKAMGIAGAMSGSPSKKHEDVRAYQTLLLQSAGASPEWIRDWFLLQDSLTDIKKLNSKTKADYQAIQRDPMRGAWAIKQLMLDWAPARAFIQSGVIQQSHYWATQARRQKAGSNESTQIIRSQVGM